VVGGVIIIVSDPGVTGCRNCEVAFNINQAVKSVLYLKLAGTLT
jgi:hypothetical protein